MFQKHSAPQGSGVIAATIPLRQGPFHSFYKNLSATFVELEKTINKLRRLFLNLFADVLLVEHQ